MPLHLDHHIKTNEVTTERLCNLCKEPFMARKFDRFCKSDNCTRRIHELSHTDPTYYMGEGSLKPIGQQSRGSSHD
jgi:hypothetical protein